MGNQPIARSVHSSPPPPTHVCRYSHPRLASRSKHTVYRQTCNFCLWQVCRFALNVYRYAYWRVPFWKSTHRNTQKDQPLLSSKRSLHFQTHKWSWNEQKSGPGSQRAPKLRTNVLASASSNLLLCYARSGTWTGKVSDWAAQYRTGSIHSNEVGRIEISHRMGPQSRAIWQRCHETSSTLFEHRATW
jgi:hypothetical protein